MSSVPSTRNENNFSDAKALTELRPGSRRKDPTFSFFIILNSVHPRDKMPSTSFIILNVCHQRPPVLLPLFVYVNDPPHVVRSLGVSIPFAAILSPGRVGNYVQEQRGLSVLLCDHLNTARVIVDVDCLQFHSKGARNLLSTSRLLELYPGLRVEPSP